MVSVGARGSHRRNVPALIDIQVILNFRVAPVSQVLGMIVNLKYVRTSPTLETNWYTYSIESIPSDKGNCVGQDRTTDSIARADADTWCHRFFGSLCDETRVQFNEVGVFVKMSELIRHFLITSEYIETCTEESASIPRLD